jgi:Asp-tRNA(Asn)/Glu-tRNA(Gln) amidotransferase C subunit
MAPNKDEAVTESVILDNPRTTKKPAQKTQTLEQTELIAQVVSKTMESVIPFMQQSQPVPQTPQRQETVKEVQARVIAQMNKEFEYEVRENAKFIQKLANCPKKDIRYISIPRVFAEYIGEYLLVSLNGSVINFPVNGRRYPVHKDFVPIIQQKVEYEDQKIDFMQKTGNRDIVEVSDVNYNR